MKKLDPVPFVFAVGETFSLKTGRAIDCSENRCT